MESLGSRFASRPVCVAAKTLENYLSWSRPDLVNLVATFQVRSDLVPNLTLTQ